MKGTLGYNKEMKEEKASGVIINHIALGRTTWFYGEENVGSWKEKLKYDFFKVSGEYKIHIKTRRGRKRGMKRLIRRRKKSKREG